jgi:hypothetical protein
MHLAAMKNHSLLILIKIVFNHNIFQTFFVYNYFDRQGSVLDCTQEWGVYFAMGSKVF